MTAFTPIIELKKDERSTSNIERPTSNNERIYLAATALDLVCCGIGALYDSEAQALLSLDPSSALLYLVAAGPVKR